ncbi:Hypothetical predicted protein [Olea europaea subsp. europaea]|uniref:Uncharacterized protein n=1 Tax=Olea europaea subsp. europaea TaxID=158383 RepID=A0A8S0SWV8_OLEEU|nr:Hypothetical predicted protein [Olea europaea subsp. europaea]
MEFEFRISEDARLRAHISQRSNLKYTKTVMDHFDERQREDFRNSSLGYLAEVSDIQFSAQLIQQLVFRTVRTDKVYELWFSMQGHLMRFSLQKSALVMGLRCGAFPEGVEYDRLLERRRCLLDGFRDTWAKKFQKAKRKKEITYTVHDFPIAMQNLLKFNLSFLFRQVWAYEALLEVGERFVQRVGERLPLLLRWSAQKQPQHRTYDAFFKNVKLHVYATLCPTDAEAHPPYFFTLVPSDDPPISILDKIARTFVAPRFNASGRDGHATRKDSNDEASEGGSSVEQTSGGDEENEWSGSDRDGEDTGDFDGYRSSTDEDTRGGDRGASSLPRPLRVPFSE